MRSSSPAGNLDAAMKAGKLLLRPPLLGRVAGRDRFEEQWASS